MFFRKLRRRVEGNTQNIHHLRDTIRNIQNGLLESFVDHETGAVYSTKFGVKKPLMIEGNCIHGSGGGGGYMPSHWGRGSLSISINMIGRSSVTNGSASKAPKLIEVGQVMSHRDFAPDCDYVMKDGKGGYKYFKKAKVKEVQAPADIEVNEKGKVVKQKKNHTKEWKK